MEETQSTPSTPPASPEPSGQLFSRRFSLFGALLILGLAGLAAYRHHTMGVPIGWTPEPPAADSSAVKQDSLGY